MGESSPEAREAMALPQVRPGQSLTIARAATLLEEAGFPVFLPLTRSYGFKREEGAWSVGPV